MSGIYPDSGVPAHLAINTVDVPTTNCNPAGELFHATQRCQPRFDPAAANAMMSELLNTVASFGITYDCSRLDNLFRALATYNPCTAQSASVAELADMTGEDRVVTCIGGEPRAVPFSDFPHNLQVLPGGVCNITSVAWALDGNGQGRLYRYNASNLEVAEFATADTYPPPFNVDMPTNPAISDHNVGHYTVSQLLADAIVDPLVYGSSIDAARLQNTLLLRSGPVQVTCPGTYTLRYLSRSGIVFDPALSGISNIALTVDDGSGEKVILTSTQLSYLNLGNFTSYESEFDGATNTYLAIGTYRFAVYVVAAKSSRNAAQIKAAALVGGSGNISSSGFLSISKAVV